MQSKRNSYSGRRRAESAGTMKRRKERATQKAKQPDEVVEVAHEGANNTPESPIRETEERGCIWWLVSSCLVLPFMVLTAWAVCLPSRIGDDNPLWQDWRFIVSFVVFSIQAFLGLRGGRYRFWLAFPFIVLTTMLIYMFWISLTDQYYIINQPDFWRDWRFIVLFVLFNSQAFLGLKEDWGGCLRKLFSFCVFFPIIVLPASEVHTLI